MKIFGPFKCTHKEVGQTAGQIIVTFRYADKSFGGTILLRIPERDDVFKIGQEYSWQVKDAQ